MTVDGHGVGMKTRQWLLKGDGMFAIHKQVIVVTDSQTVSLGGFLEVVSFAVQKNGLVMYYVADLEAADILTDVEIAIVGTGRPFRRDALKGLRYMGTHSMFDGDLMWHVFVNKNLREMISELF